MARRDLSSNTPYVTVNTAATGTLSPVAPLFPNATLRLTLTGSLTLNGPTGAADGQSMTVELIQDATGGRVLTLGTGFALGTDITGVTLTTTAGKRDFLGLRYNTTTARWYIVAFTRGF